MKTVAPTRGRGVCRVRSVLVFAAVFVVAAATLQAQGTAVRVETFSLKPDGEVVVENPRGATRVESWGNPTVRVVAEKKAAAESSIEAGELVLMGAQNSLLVQCKRGSGRLDLTLYVPETAQVQVTGGAWPVDIRGSLGGAAVDTTSGNIAYGLPVNEDARVDMHSAQGVVRSTLALLAVERTGIRSLRGQIGTGATQIILNSQNGNITLTPTAAVARTPNRERVGSAVGSQSSQDVPSGRADTDRQVQGVQQPDESSSPTSRGPVQQDTRGTGGGTNRATGSVVFSGSDRSDESSSTARSGPFVRPRQERNTSSGNSGLNVRIIPSDTPPQSSQNRTGSVYDQSRDEDDTQKSGKSPANGSSGARSSNSTSDSVVFAGSDRADDDTSNSRIGPLQRNRQSRDTSGGNSGIKVRIIPSNAPPGPSRSSGTVFDSRDQLPAAGDTSMRSPSQPNAAPDTPMSTSSGRSSNTSGRDSNGRSVWDANQQDTEETNTRSGAPPVLHRTTAPDSSSTSTAGEAGRRPETPEEEAVVLKAALVNLNVSVTNRSGVALANLKQEDFDVAENGEAQKIAFFQPTTAPFNLVLALDLSGSIKDKLDVVKSAALRFLDIVGPQDKVAVVTFTDEIRVVSQLTADREELRRRIKMIDRSQGGTAFYEAVWFSLVDTLRGTRGQRNAIVVMTDGVDSSLDRYNPIESRVSFGQLSRRLEESDVIVFPIYLDTEYEEVFERGNSSSEAYAIARDQLERIAEVSGGQMFKAEKAGDLSGVYKQVAAAIRTVYSVGYYPTNPERDGTFRRVRVVVNRSDAAVRTRKGYYAR